MKAHKYWSLGALATMIGTFYTGYKNMKTAHKSRKKKDPVSEEAHTINHEYHDTTSLL